MSGALCYCGRVEGHTGPHRGQRRPGRGRQLSFQEVARLEVARLEVRRAAAIQTMDRLREEVGRIDEELLPLRQFTATTPSPAPAPAPAPLPKFEVVRRPFRIGERE